MRDKPYRSLLKAISWRLTGSLDTIVVSWLLTGKLTLAVSIGAVEALTKTLLYFLHERAWNRSSLGREKAAEPDYTI